MAAPRRRFTEHGDSAPHLPAHARESCSGSSRHARGPALAVSNQEWRRQFGAARGQAGRLPVRTFSLCSSGLLLRLLGERGPHQGTRKEKQT